MDKSEGAVAPGPEVESGVWMRKQVQLKFNLVKNWVYQGTKLHFTFRYCSNKGGEGKQRHKGFDGRWSRPRGHKFGSEAEFGHRKSDTGFGLPQKTPNSADWVSHPPCSPGSRFRPRYRNALLYQGHEIRAKPGF